MTTWRVLPHGKPHAACFTTPHLKLLDNIIRHKLAAWLRSRLCLLIPPDGGALLVLQHLGYCQRGCEGFSRHRALGRDLPVGNGCAKVTALVPLFAPLRQVRVLGQRAEGCSDSQGPAAEGLPPYLGSTAGGGAGHGCCTHLSCVCGQGGPALLVEPSGEGDKELLLLHLKALSTTKHFPAAARCV